MDKNSISVRLSKLENLILKESEPKEKQLKDIKVGDKVKMRLKSGKFVSGKISGIKGKAVSAETSDGEDSLVYDFGNSKGDFGKRGLKFESKSTSKYSLNESFKSKSIAQFIKALKMSGESKGLPYKLRDIEWSEIPEDKVLFLTPDKVQPYVKPEFVIIWGTKSEKVIKYESPTYSRTGFRRDNNRKIGPGCIAFTMGRKYLMSSYNQDRLQIATTDYDTPGQGYMSFLKLRTEIADYALVIDLEDLELYRKNYRDKTRSRRTSQEGATALMKNIDIANENLRRYKEIAKDNKINSNTKETRQEVSMLLNSLQSKINALAGSEILSTKKDYYEEDIFELNTATLEKLKKLISAYNNLSTMIVRYMKDASRYGLEHSYSIRKMEYLEKCIEDAKTLL